MWARSPLLAKRLVRNVVANARNLVLPLLVLAQQAFVRLSKNKENVEESLAGSWSLEVALVIVVSSCFGGEGGVETVKVCKMWCVEV
tara:strand:- start:406 stop:666 length:261 start_codon:yes stop_codon:yes gene_type:complete